ncbi:hypothetical protein GUJ93_ZPchr0007g4119 [Zizania palustris]|uniref:FHA domain-containing protein n=2 Tax=Zizania palustris TaxID=103762 RepID=A0A8J5T6Q8_ZIZPA|nr:hypothetical protein GUJ93_ZPchr0007g4119 [Zizania palustris]KAG8080984.1 hypothetical protein GUJ93_ZPchr0007g4119 [Zizania palustris]
MRKRVFNEPHLAADFGYVPAPCSCPVGSGCVCDGLLNLSEGYHLVHKVNPAAAFVNSCGHIGESYADGQDAYAKDNRHYIFHERHDKAAGIVAIDGNINYEIVDDCSDVGKLYRYDSMQKNTQSSEMNIACPKNLSDVQEYAQLQQQPLCEKPVNEVTGSEALLDIDQDGIEQGQFSGNDNEVLQEPDSFNAISQHCCSQASCAPTWKQFQGVNSIDVLTDMHHQEQNTFFDDKKKETTNIDTIAFEINMDKEMPGSGLGNAKEGKVMHLCLKDVGPREDFELLNSNNILVSSFDSNMEDMVNADAKVILKDISKMHHDDNTDPLREKHVAVISGADMVHLSEVSFPGSGIVCVLNIEDPEIPCNDDIIIPDPLASTSTCDQKSQHNMHLVSTKPIPPLHADDLNHTNLVRDVQPLSLPMKLEPCTLEQKETLVDLSESCTVKSKPSGMHCNTSTHHSAAEFIEQSTCGLVQHEGFGNLGDVALDKSIGVLAQTNSKFLDEPGISCEIAIQNTMPSHALPDVEFHNPITTIPSSGQAEGGSDSENSVPNYFDIEALILDQDLIPYDQESDFIRPEVSRFQSLESRKDLIRLEQGARSYMNRSIMFHGAFAVLYGQHLKYYIRDQEVTLGRETGEVHVDIDLGKEGKANKISRRQAIIKMDEGGSFHIKNIGKSPIFVNSKEVPCHKRINLISDALLQIRDMKFIFHIYQDAVRKQIVRTRRGTSQGQNKAFAFGQKP